jgi:pyruvate kinase
MQRTKIICTLGPASNDEATIRALIEAGMDVARLNFSHDTQEDHLRTLQTVRRVADELSVHVAVMQDLQGPKIRVGEMADGPVNLQAGDTLTITTDPVKGRPGLVSTTYEGLPKDVKPGDCILLDDGLLELRVKEVSGKETRCEVVVGGLLKEHKGINLPGIRVSAPALTAKDVDDLAFGLSHGVDYVAQSFVREPDDVRNAKQLIAERGADVPVVAKIEKPEAVEKLGELVAAADAVMVARGDLAVETSPELVPVLQKRIIAECRRARIPVVTATQMLESMTHNPRPTRAEASDVANAVFDGSDAIMLSGETAVGKYPVEAVSMMRRIAQAAENAALLTPAHGAHGDERLSFADTIARAAYDAALDLDTSAIVACTHSGFTAQLASKCRPPVPIIAATPFPETARRAALYWGVLPLVVQPYGSIEEMMDQIDERILETGIVKKGDTVVVIAGTPIGRRGTTNMMRLFRIGES